ncbi:hypothetical protein [Streptomyces sp. NPDC001068]|uniref:hypothetical protein n=1 Tax=Streptomyces sp. NPDC001068 TaxID=3364544 RepID=UPI003682AD81
MTIRIHHCCHQPGAYAPICVWDELHAHCPDRSTAVQYLADRTGVPARASTAPG